MADQSKRPTEAEMAEGTAAAIREMKIRWRACWRAGFGQEADRAQALAELREPAADPAKGHVH